MLNITATVSLTSSATHYIMSRALSRHFCRVDSVLCPSAMVIVKFDLYGSTNWTFGHVFACAALLSLLLWTCLDHYPGRPAARNAFWSRSRHQYQHRAVSYKWLDIYRAFTTVHLLCQANAIDNAQRSFSISGRHRNRLFLLAW